VRGRRAVMAGTAGHMGWSDWVWHVSWQARHPF
jgi:hypothetical protein